MQTQIQKTTQTPQIQNANLENDKKDAKSGVVSLVAGACIGLVGVAAAGISTITGYTGINYLYSYLNPPEGEQVVAERLIKENGLEWMKSSGINHPEYKRSRAAATSRIMCTLSKRSFAESYEKGFMPRIRPETLPQTPSLTKLAQEAWNEKEGLSYCLETDPWNAATAGVLITTSLVAAYASYKLLKRAFAS